VDNAGELISRVYQDLGDDIFGSRDIRSALAARDPDERAFLALVMCGAEIDNGGFEQLFSNSSDEIAQHGTEGAERFGLPQHATIIHSAWQQWVELTGQELNDPDPRLSELDEEWYSLNEELESRLFDFAKQRQTDS
jgi:hypothetical protein